MTWTREDEERLASEFEASHPAAAEHLRYHDWVDAYASRIITGFGVPPPDVQAPYPGDYNIDWPREIRLNMNDHEWIFKVFFADRLVCVVKPAPYRESHHRLRRLIITAAERYMNYPEGWAT